LIWRFFVQYRQGVNTHDPIQCTKCGKCCLADMNAYVTPDDLQRWKRENRHDILHIMENEHAIWAGDHFISSIDGRYLHGCPFLKWEGGLYACSIYETRPQMCRDYQPGSSELCPQWKLFK
jgi:Fe-S-cluster containining protein